MLSRLVLVFLFVVQTNSLSVLTDDKSQATKTDGETVLVRQLLNQETLIGMALDRKVNDLVKGMAEMKKNMETSNQKLQDAKREIEINNQQLQDAKREIRTNNLQLQDAKRETEASKQQLRDAITEIETNNQQLQDAKKEIETNTQQIHDAKKEIETNNQQLKDAKREIETNNQQLQDAKREIETNNQQLQDAKREIETNNQQLLGAKREIETNKQQLQDAKREIETNNQQLQDAKAEIVSLRNEVLLLKNQNRKSKADALKFQEKINVRFVRTDENITQVVNSQEQLNTNLNERFETFQINTSYNIADIQTKMDVLNMSLLDLKKQTTKLNTSLPEAIDKKLADVSANWNRSLSELNYRFVNTWSKLDNDHANKMAQLSGTLSWYHI